MKKIISLSIVCVSLMLASCGEDFLNLIPESTLSSDGFYKTQTDMNMATLAIYQNLRGLYNGNIHRLGEIRSDNTTYSWLSGNPANERQNDEFREPYLENNSYLHNHWNDCYSIIYRANLVLGNLPTATFDTQYEPLRIQYEAEARFLRALAYFKLNLVFGGEATNSQLLGVCKVDKVITQNEAYEMSRATLEEIYNFIIEDLTFAQANLPKSYASTDVGRAKRSAAAAMLAKVYVHMAGWPLNKGNEYYNKAIAQIDKFFTEYPEVKLVGSYKDLFDVTKKNSVESLFEIQYLKGAAGEATSCNWNGDWAPRNGEPDVIPFSGSSGVNAPTDDMSKAYEPGDPRKYVSMRNGYRRAATNAWVNVNFVCKYYDTPTTGTNFGNNWIELRLGDIHLLYAEALVRTGGDKAKALSYLNGIRKRARETTLVKGFPHKEDAEFPAFVALPADGLKDYQLSDFADDNAFLLAIEKERRVELAFESHRWFDLLRTGRAKDVMIAQQTDQWGPFKWEDRALLNPIPESAQRSMPGKLIQNKGYVQF